MLLPSLSLGSNWRENQAAHQAHKVVDLITSATSPQQAVRMMASALENEAGSVRDAAVKASVMVMAQHRYHPQLDHASLFRLLCSSLEDPCSAVRIAALEAMSMLHSCMGSADFQKMLTTSYLLKDSTKQLIRQRLEDPSPPFLNVTTHQTLELAKLLSPKGGSGAGQDETPERSSAPTLQTLSSIASALAAAQPADTRRRIGDRRTTDGGYGGSAHPPPSSQFPPSFPPTSSQLPPWGLGSAARASDSALGAHVTGHADLAGLATPRAWGGDARCSVNIKADQSSSSSSPNSLPTIDVLSTPKHATYAAMHAHVPQRYGSDAATCKSLGHDLEISSSESNPLAMRISAGASAEHWGEDLVVSAAPQAPISVPVPPTPMRPRLRTDPGTGLAFDPAGSPRKLPLIVKQGSGQRGGRAWGSVPEEHSIDEEAQLHMKLPEPRHSGQGLVSDVDPSVSRSISLENLKRCIKERQAGQGLASAGAGAGARRTPQASSDGYERAAETPETPTASCMPSPFSLPGIRVSLAGLGEAQHQLQAARESPSPTCGGGRSSCSGQEGAGPIGGRRSRRSSASSGYEVGAAAGVARGKAGASEKMEEVLFENLLPLRDPEHSLRAALAAMQIANVADRKELDWQAQNDALNDCRRLVKHHPSVVCPALPELVAATVPAIDALRSFTAKVALVLYQELFSLLGRAADPYLGSVAPMLLKRAAEVSNAGRENFLAIEARSALVEMCYSVPGARAVTALVACSNHKAPNVRMCVAQLLDLVIELATSGLGCWPAPTANWPLLEKAFKAAVGFLSEGALETRTYGKRIMWGFKQLLVPAELSSLVAHYSPAPAAQKKLQETLDAIAEHPPLPHTRLLSAAAMVVRGSGSGPSRAQHSAAGASSPPFHLPVAPSPMAGPRALARAGSYKGPVAQPDTPLLSAPPQLSTRNSAVGGSRDGPCVSHAAGGLKPIDSVVLARMLHALGSKDFRDRVEALKGMEAILPETSASSDTVLMQLLDALTVRLGDGNSKVVLQALQTLGQLTEGLRERMAIGLSTLVPALAANLGSGTDKVRAAAAHATTRLVASMHPATLLQPLCHSVGSGSVRNKAVLVDALETVVNALCPARSQLVIKYALPAAVSLANDIKGGAESKAAANQLLSLLARQLGHQLLEHTGGMPALLQQRVADMVASSP